MKSSPSPTKNALRPDLCVTHVFVFIGVCKSRVWRMPASTTHQLHQPSSIPTQNSGFSSGPAHCESVPDVGFNDVGPTQMWTSRRTLFESYVRFYHQLLVSLWDETYFLGKNTTLVMSVAAEWKIFLFFKSCMLIATTSLVHSPETRPPLTVFNTEMFYSYIKSL